MFLSAVNECVTICPAMGNRRTRKEKIIAQLRRAIRENPPLPEVSQDRGFVLESLTREPTAPATQGNLSPLLSYDPSLLRKDLLRTLLLSVLSFGIEGVLTFIL